jgi:RNA polymerase sigma-70 factor (ECF subfamily)
MGMVEARLKGSIEKDEVLVDRARRGDELAFAGLVDRHSRDAVATAIGLLGNRTEAEEAAQEAFCRAWQRLGTLEDPAKFRVWVVGILYRHCHDVLRAKGRARKVLGAYLPSVPEPDEKAAAVVEEAMQLPEEYRDPLILFYLQQMTVAELAQVLGLSDENVKVRLHRGRRMLRERLERKGMS